MNAPELSFRTYKECSPGVPGESLGAKNARLERELARRYIDQADNAMRLAIEALARARIYEERGR